MSDCTTCEMSRDLGGASASYRRALLAVAALNLAMGGAEFVGGLLASSQALRADSLDFFGDGLITGFAFVALRRGARWRARAALTQGLFLGALGLGVLAVTAYRSFVGRQPEAELMGAFGVAALLVNLLAAALLLPHRRGDASARAVWLFSRNDALGNIGVVAAALLVGWTGSSWPDLVAAAAIASLFLVSSARIVREARAELRRPA